MIIKLISHYARYLRAICRRSRGRYTLTVDHIRIAIRRCTLTQLGRIMAPSERTLARVISKLKSLGWFEFSPPAPGRQLTFCLAGTNGCQFYDSSKSPTEIVKYSNTGCAGNTGCEPIPCPKTGIERRETGGEPALLRLAFVLAKKFSSEIWENCKCRPSVPALAAVFRELLAAGHNKNDILAVAQRWLHRHHGLAVDAGCASWVPSGFFSDLRADMAARKSSPAEWYRQDRLDRIDIREQITKSML